MNVAYPGPWPQISTADALLMDVARRIQLTKTKHETAERNFRALCQHVDRDGSPLHTRVIECYPSGSFATGTAIASRVASFAAIIARLERERAERSHEPAHPERPP